MKRFFVLLLIAALIIGLFLFFTNPGMLDKVWIWLIGFLGAIVGFFRNLFEQIKDVFKEEKTDSHQKQEYSNSSQQSAVTPPLHKTQIAEAKNQIVKETAHTHSSFEGTTITLVRFMHDKETTLGLLYLGDTFVCYTLEDTYRPVKIRKETRIPAGTYPINFRISDPPSGLTQKYRERKNLQGIFTHHLEVKNVPNFDYVYLHIGNDHGDTDGCILLANGISANTIHRSIISSEKAYIGFYQKVRKLLEQGENVRIIIHDEDWLQKI